MVQQRRAFNYYPENLQTDYNNKETAVLDDNFYEPETSSFVTGYVGDVSTLTEEDLERTPVVGISDVERSKYQLEIGVANIDPITRDYQSGAFYKDLLSDVVMNGGIGGDENRLFETTFYAWTPPIDYDKHINFTRYYWIGQGDASANGDYIVKEVRGSRLVIHQVSGGSLVEHEVTIATSAPTNPSVGDMYEDATFSNRPIYRYNGTAWVLIDFDVVSDIPSDLSGYLDGSYLYVARTGPSFQQYTVWKYSEVSGRHVSHQVVVNPETPDTPREGMIWEDSTIRPNRVLRVYQNGGWQQLSYQTLNGPDNSAVYTYDSEPFSDVTDGWSTNNWWRHYEDLSSVDRDNVAETDQALRPIIEFWAFIESDTTTKTGRNQSPIFTVYEYDADSEEIEPTGDVTTICEYKIGSGSEDPVLGIPLSYNDTGEFEFTLTLESDITTGGYHFYRDAKTGLVHSIWAKSDERLQQEIDANGLYETPKNLTSNADHGILTEFSRSVILEHMSGNIAAQEDISGSEFGLNSYRWTDKNPTVGVTLIDPEYTLLRGVALMQNSNLNIPDAIRRMAAEYNRVIYRFTNRLNQVWDTNDVCDGAGQLIVPAEDVVNSVLTRLFFGRTEDFPFYYSQMGEFVQTEIIGGVVNTFDSTLPIFIPCSPARIGAAPAYEPRSFVGDDGDKYLITHDGRTIPSFGDDRDDVMLALENIFYNAIPEVLRVESLDYSARNSQSRFHLEDYYGDLIPTTTTNNVDEIVPDYTALTGVSANYRVFDSGRYVYAIYSGESWLTSDSAVDDIFYDTNTDAYYINNGMALVKIDTYNHSTPFDYSMDEFRSVMRREFERWANATGRDFVSNEIYDENDPFTWNYTTAGVEGNWRGIYHRLYNTVRPHITPWEVVGYVTKPTWWDTAYTPDSVASDGLGRYADTNPMWDDFRNGIINPLTGDVDMKRALVAPTPVDASGALLDPIAAGVVDEDDLVVERLDDFWRYGDGSPAEEEFRNSPYYSFAVSLAGYLMKPGIFVGATWAELTISIGENGTNKLWRAPHIVQSITNTRSPISDVGTHLSTDENGDKVVNVGLNAWIAENLVISGSSVDGTLANIMENSAPSLAWKTYGYVNSNRTDISTLSGRTVPFEDVNTILYQSAPTKELYQSGVQIFREGTGFQVYGYNAFDPFFTVELPAVPIIGGQVELRQEFVSTEGQHRFEVTEFTLPRSNDTARLAVLVDGNRLKSQHVTVENNEVVIEDIVTMDADMDVTVIVLTTTSNPSTQVRKFSIGETDFMYFAKGSGEYTTIEYGRFFPTITDVINFMIGYGRYLESEGWVYDETDGGVPYDWLTGAKRFAQWALIDDSPWVNNYDYLDVDRTVFRFSPFNKKAQINTDFGQVLNVESVKNGSYGIVDQYVNPIDPARTNTTRIGDTMTITADENTEMYGVRVFLVEYQHVVFLSNVTRFNDLIYNPITAQYHQTLVVDAYRSDNWDGRLSAGGSIITNDGVLPNFEKLASDIPRYYDRSNTVDDPVKRDQARNLYGWYPNDTYMDPIGADDRSRFDYYRGMIQSKGTNRPINAFARGTRIGTDNVFVYEDWAWKVAEYGDTRKSVVQFRVNKDDFKANKQVFVFGESPTRNVTGIEAFDRNNPEDNTRWLLPPEVSDASGIGNVRFPMKNGLPDVNGNNFFLKLFDTVGDFTLLRHYLYDPQQGKFDPTIYGMVDFENFYDPARYNMGQAQEKNDLNVWGAERVGTIWWNTKRRKFNDYRADMPNYERTAANWGTLLSVGVDEMTRVGNTVTVTTSEPHNLQTDDRVTISGADQEGYNLVDVLVTVTGTTTFEYSVTELPDTPATGTIRVTIGAIELYEWIESPVRPSEWADYVAGQSNPSITGTVLNPENPSYTRILSTNSRGRQVSTYYFWVKNNTIIQTGRDMSLYDMARRVQNPTTFLIPWFAPIDSTSMVVYTDGEQVQDGYGIEIITDNRNQDTHVEWVVISENDRFNSIPTVVTDKIIDSISGIDVNGTTVPSSALIERERYGNSFAPSQTLYRDRETAIDTFVESVNNILATKNLSPYDSIVAVFDENDTFWSKAEYINAAYENKEVYDTVTTEAIRDRKEASGLYVEGDLVRVLESSNTDPWTGDPVSTIYSYEDGLFIEVGVGNATVEINDTIADDPIVFRSIFYSLLDVFENEEVNALTFSMIYETLRQNPDCDWLFKTSYISVQIFDVISKSPFLRPSEVDAIIENIKDVKPYRTKLRSEQATYTIQDTENVNVEIREFPDQKITLVFDRLSHEFDDDFGWDTAPWDTVPWDRPSWELDDLGTNEFYEVARFDGDATETVYTVNVEFDAYLYNHRGLVYDNGVLVDDPLYTPIISVGRSSVTATLPAPLPPTYELVIESAFGLYEGSSPVITDGESFTPAENTYRHAVVRAGLIDGRNPGEVTVTAPETGFNELTGQVEIIGPDIQHPLMAGYEPDGSGIAEERIESKVVDSLHICVKTSYTPLFSGWDSTPWDSTGWDNPPADSGDHVFFVTSGNQPVVPSGIETFDTTYTTTVNDGGYARTKTLDVPFYSVYLKNGQYHELEKNIDYDQVDEHIIRLYTKQDEFFTADGVVTEYSYPGSATEIDQVYVNNELMVEGVDYNTTGIGEIAFEQPDPVNVPRFASVITREYVANGSGSETFSTGNTSLLNKNDVFVFLNGSYVNSSDYTMTGGIVELNTPPSLDDEIIVLSYYDPEDYNIELFGLYVGAGTGVLKNHNVGFGATLDNTFVYVDGVYQVPGTDYTSPSAGTIKFDVAPINGAVVEVRSIKNVYDALVKHVELITNGTDELIIDDGTTQIGDNEVNRMMVYLDGELQDGYTSTGVPDYYILDTNPDTIKWETTPAGGLPVSVRFIKRIRSAVTQVPGVFPQDGSKVRLVPEQFWVAGQEVKFVYDKWYVGPLGGYLIQSVPTSDGYDIVDGILTTDFKPFIATFNGDGSTTEFDIGYVVPDSDLVVTVGNTVFVYTDDAVPASNEYTIDGTNIVLGTAPSNGVLIEALVATESSLVVDYQVDRVGKSPMSILARMEMVVDELISDHTAYDTGSGFDNTRRVGTTVVNSTDFHVYIWDGTQWVDDGILSSGDKFYSKRDQGVWEYDGSSLVNLFNIGDPSGSVDEVLDYPSYGIGVLSGTYALGQNVVYTPADGSGLPDDKENDFPEAYKIMQRDGGC